MDGRTDRPIDRQGERQTDRETETYTDGLCYVVDVSGGDVEWYNQLLTFVVQPLTQRVPAHEELHTQTHTQTHTHTDRQTDRQTETYRQLSHISYPNLFIPRRLVHEASLTLTPNPITLTSNPNT